MKQLGYQSILEEHMIFELAKQVVCKYDKDAIQWIKQFPEAIQKELNWFDPVFKECFLE
jgi:hypothetical protein